ncbi:hypothetical protein PR048_014194 [Dryococelus australis]|uniref:Uncharacterized protein n=1 Tax=Dryococelus australis TaxID=614101 RepID=A0ABQ9HDI5_9NEOP|nr:hypothetical protein PR048_014194 [Dryococelus australis]
MVKKPRIDYMCVDRPDDGRVCEPWASRQYIWPVGLWEMIPKPLAAVAGDGVHPPVDEDPKLGFVEPLRGGPGVYAVPVGLVLHSPDAACAQRCERCHGHCVLHLPHLSVFLGDRGEPRSGWLCWNSIPDANECESEWVTTALPRSLGGAIIHGFSVMCRLARNQGSDKGHTDVLFKLPIASTRQAVQWVEIFWAALTIVVLRVDEGEVR